MLAVIVPGIASGLAGPAGTQKSGYSARIAQLRSEQRARRPKTGKLGRCPALRTEVQAWLVKKFSPEQIAGELARTYPDRPEMQVSHETIYKALYVQGRGELRRELTKCLRTGRALRKPRHRSRAGSGRIPGMVNISERPAEAADRAVPGHWEGDLIIGKTSAPRSARWSSVPRDSCNFCICPLDEILRLWPR
ncbi:hypothetical protein MOTT12_01107 [Mycobacterium intracellulare subsp. yongonense]|nr:hypothetical protein MOTT12_01107 [Mycobacterium intracellulare subsp. yongonense]